MREGQTGVTMTTTDGNELTESLREAAERFMLPLRIGEGFDPDALDALCEQVDRCGRLWSGAPSVPKAAALILAELYPALDECAALHQDPLRLRIVHAAGRVRASVSASLDG